MSEVQDIPARSSDLAPPVADGQSADGGHEGVAVNAATNPSPPSKRSTARTEPRWMSEARDRVKSHTRRSMKPMQEMQARDANEGDTRLLVTDFLTEAFGFDKYEDLTTEYQVKGEFADYGIRIDRQLVAFVEVKRISQHLSERHLRQVQMYAVNEGVEWLILTNARVWQVWHLTGGLPVLLDLVFEVDLLDSSTATKTVVDALLHLSKEALKRRTIEELWRERAATAPKMLASVLLTAPVVDALRKELRRKTGHNADASALAAIVQSTVLRPELV